MKKRDTRELIQALEKKGKKESKKIFLAIAKILSKPRKNLARVNLWKLSKLSEKNSGKTLVVCGKVLGVGKASSELNVYAFSVSEKALKKIVEAKSKIHPIEELLNVKEKDLVLVK